MSKQVDKQHYRFRQYCDLDRFASYWHQLHETLSLAPCRVLEIGVGDKVFANYLQSNTDIEYHCADVAEDLNPHIVASVTELPIEDNAYDLVCAFEVLEHLPYDQFPIALKELHRVTRKHVILSLPHWGRHVSVKIRLPFFKKFQWHRKFHPHRVLHKFNGEHYWEIGKWGYGLSSVLKDINAAGFMVKKEYTVFDAPYHHFFVLEKKV